MTSTVQQTRNAVTLRGSAAMISEFFNYGVNSILYQRGIYPPETFTRKIKMLILNLIGKLSSSQEAGIWSNFIGVYRVRSQQVPGERPDPD